MSRLLVLAFVASTACGGDLGGGGMPGDDMPPIDAAPPIASGCIDDVSSGDHLFTCGGLQVDARVPAVCQAPGCGLILLLHGDTGSGLLIDGHMRLRDLGDQHGFIVVAPTGPPYGQGQPGSTWHGSNDTTLVDIVQQLQTVFRTDAAKTHVAGFSRGGFVTWRLLCDHADLFASAAPGGAGNGANFGEDTCFEAGRNPSREIPILFLMGRTDAAVGYSSMMTIRDAAIARYGATGPVTMTQDGGYRHDRWMSPGGTAIETFDHAYETVIDGPFGDARGHCIPGSTTDPYAQQYAIPCKLPNSFVWGDEVMTFFLAHPRN